MHSATWAASVPQAAGAASCKCFTSVLTIALQRNDLSDRRRSVDEPVWEALSDPTRRHVVQLLGERPYRAGELATASGTSAPAMSRHLRVLLDAGVVVDERVVTDARVRVFRLRPDSARRAPGVARPGAGALGRPAAGVQAPCREARCHMTENSRSVRELPSASCSVEVGVDPQTAFAAFTDEMDNWWMRSPISYYDSARAIAPPLRARRRWSPARGLRRRNR